MDTGTKKMKERQTQQLDIGNKMKTENSAMSEVALQNSNKKIVETEGTIDIRKTHIFISAHYSESILITSGVVKIAKRVQTSTILNNAEIQV